MNLLDHGDQPIQIRHVCEVSRDATATTGAGIMLLADDMAQGSIATTNETSAMLEQLQYTSGEGPCLDAYDGDYPVIIDDLEHNDRRQWRGFCPQAIEAGAYALFGFPLRVGSAGLGTLTMYRNEAGPLTEDQHADALVMANIAAQVILAAKTNTSPTQLIAELRTGTQQFEEVHQATGMVSVQLHVTLAEAMTRLRGEAFSSGVPLRQLATAVVDRSFRFRADTAEGQAS